MSKLLAFLNDLIRTKAIEYALIAAGILALAIALTYRQQSPKLRIG
jgi:Flp pilus assembly pilin Flp